MKLSLCLETQFEDQPFPERIKSAATHGYKAFEFWDWRDKPVEAVARTARQLGLTIAAMSGNRQHPLIDPVARGGLIGEVLEVLEVAEKLSCKCLMMLSDALAPDGSAMATPPMTTEEKIRSMVEGLRVLSRPAEPAGVTLLLEPLNSLIDHPGCFLDSVALAVEVVGRLNSPRVKVLYDIYHMHVMGKNVLREIENNQEWIGYFHVADSPGRHQPGTGEIDYAAVGELLGRLKYRGFVGMEFAPLGPSAEAVKAPIETFARFTHA